MSDEADESPLAGRAYESASAGLSGTSERNIGNTSTVNDEEDGEDVPNWIAFADYAKWVHTYTSQSLFPWIVRLTLMYPTLYDLPDPVGPPFH